VASSLELDSQLAVGCAASASDAATVTEPITVETSHRVLVRKPFSAISKLRMSDSIRLAAKDVSSGEQATGRRRSVSVAPSGKRAPADRSMNNLWWEAWRVEPKSVRPAQWL
jgi:hypothetical protein